MQLMQQLEPNYVNQKLQIVNDVTEDFNSFNILFVCLKNNFLIYVSFPFL